jgi:predicted RNase H-like HicB family nuclease
MSAQKKKYTAIIRKSQLEYVAVCLELNVTARGEDLPQVEKNLRDAIVLYLEDIKTHPETVAAPISTEEFIEFLRDTEPEWYKEPAEGLILRPLEIHEVPSYA